MFGSGYAIVREPEDNDPDHGGGPIRRSGFAVVPAAENLPGYPLMVKRTPHPVVNDAESGGARYPWLTKMKFLPDGRIVRQDALSGFAGFGADPVAAAAASTIAPSSAASAAATAVPTAPDPIKRYHHMIAGGALVGAAWGLFSSKEHRAAGLGLGTLLGAGFGALIASVFEPKA
jgi:hypothetical protein